MKRRWKVGMALAVVGISGFLVWVFNLSATPPLTLRFQGYITNSAPRAAASLIIPPGTVLAVFAVTNQTRRVLPVMASSIYGSPPEANGDPAAWIVAPNGDGAHGQEWAILKPGEGALVGAIIRESGQPVGIEAIGSIRYEIETAWDRILTWMPWVRGTYSVIATNEPR